MDVYQRPYDPLYPVVCLDETNQQLTEKRSIPLKPGCPEREDCEYRRRGVVDLFMAFEPLACKRAVKLTNTRTAVDFAHFFRDLVDIHYSHLPFGDLLPTMLDANGEEGFTRPLYKIQAV